jgi:hypothetical protein
MTHEDVAKEKKRAEIQADKDLKAANPIPVVVVDDEMV